LHGVVVGQLSPLKMSKKRTNVKYYDDTFSDGRKSVRLDQHFVDAQREQHVVVLENCILKRNRDELEILVENKPTMLNCPKKFRVSEDDTLVRAPDLVTKADLKDIAKRQQITLVGKILSINKVEQVLIKGSGQLLLKREVVLADFTVQAYGIQ